MDCVAAVGDSVSCAIHLQDEPLLPQRPRDVRGESELIAAITLLLATLRLSLCRIVEKLLFSYALAFLPLISEFFHFRH